MLINLKKFIYLRYLLLLVFFSSKGEKAHDLFFKAPKYPEGDWRCEINVLAMRLLAIKDLEYASFWHLAFLYDWISYENKQVVIEKMRGLLPLEIEDARSGRRSSYGRGYQYLLLLSHTPREMWREFNLHSFFDEITDEQIEALKERIELNHSIGGSFYSSTMEKISSREDLHL